MEVVHKAPTHLFCVGDRFALLFSSIIKFCANVETQVPSNCFVIVYKKINSMFRNVNPEKKKVIYVY